MIWIELVSQYGENEARKILANRLRECADLVELPGYPDVFDARIPDHNRPLCDGTIVDSVEVILSYPWGG